MRDFVVTASSVLPAVSAAFIDDAKKSDHGRTAVLCSLP